MWTVQCTVTCGVERTLASNEKINPSGVWNLVFGAWLPCAWDKLGDVWIVACSVRMVVTCLRTAKLVDKNVKGHLTRVSFPVDGPDSPEKIC